MKIKFFLLLVLLMCLNYAYGGLVFNYQNLVNRAPESIIEVSSTCPKEGLLPFRFKNWSLLSGTLLGAASCPDSPFMPESISLSQYGFLARKLIPYPHLRRAFLVLNFHKHSLAKYIFISDRVIPPKSSALIYFLCPYEDSDISIIQSSHPKSRDKISLTLVRAVEPEDDLLKHISRTDRSNLRIFTGKLILPTTGPYVLTVTNNSNSSFDYSLIFEFLPPER